MTIFYALLGLLLCSIIITAAQIKSEKRKEVDELMEIFEKVETDN
jgi:hypothetical protein